MSIRTLRTFLAIARHGSFAAAAHAIGLTQSAVSLQMKQLEEALGVELFDRSHRSPRPNAAGRAFLERAERVVTLYDELGTDLAADGQLTGRLVLGAIHTVQVGPLPDAIAALRAQHPAVQIHLRSGLSAELAAAVDQGELDAALITEPPAPLGAGLDWTCYDTECFYVLAPPGLDPQAGEALLAEHPLIRFDKRAWAGRVIDEALRRRGIASREIMELDSLEATMRMVERGLGVTVAPLGARRRHTLDSRFTIAPFGVPPLERRVGLLEKSAHPRRRLTAALIEALRQASLSSV